MDNKKESGALLLSALIIMTILATLAASIARIQGSRGDIVTELANAYALDDLAHTAINITLGEMVATLCQPHEITGATTDAQGRSTINRTIINAGSLTIAFCPQTAGCYATDWGVAGKNVEWVVSITSTTNNQQKTQKLGINTNNSCNPPQDESSLIDIDIAYWR
ncbi:MAG: hypothetical protein HQL69_10445 [Magnetococcales bacterium]|nr:hypothetical protein [Magnetococcales bacterium]